MQKITTLVILSLLSAHSYGQSNYQQFTSLFKKKDTAALKTLLANWERTAPNDPELYTSAFNFYFSGSRREMLSLQKNAPKEEGLRVTDNSGKTVAFLTSGADYDADKLARAFGYINTGIAKFPDRLDMRFGKCFVFGQIADYENFTKEIIATVDRSVVNKNNWRWTENKPPDQPEELLLSSIQSYLAQLYNTENDDLLDNMIRIGEATLKHYPGNVEILTTTSTAFLLKKNYDKALGYLQRAEKLNPKDGIVLNNIAHCYKLKGDKTNALKYYELTEKYSDEEGKAMARENIKQLKK
ncbi:tetratricopeptide repeat protein [Chitinophaga sp. GCM10012297]|uniref:Tetratricopeptide repeat protein n=1 Tax=Chitinophaga chungangae TaxID=2821488 RepID=A0ABS3YAA3_9BACT|nr:hypothetical protein [Chitinophaga chungangae]MBO9151607.1 hypothetical protein [Chitinophaga chungangae]